MFMQLDYICRQRLGPAMVCYLHTPASPSGSWAKKSISRKFPPLPTWHGWLID